MEPVQAIAQIRQSLLRADHQKARSLARTFLANAPKSDVVGVAARHFILAGNVSKARTVIADLLQVGPTAEAYYLASLVAATEAQRISFLKEAVRLDPFHPLAGRELESTPESLGFGGSYGTSPVAPVDVWPPHQMHRYSLLRWMFVLGFSLDFASVFVPTLRMSLGFFGTSGWDSYLSLLRFYQKVGESDTWLFMVAVMAMVVFALLGARLPSRAVFALGGAFSIAHIFLRWFYGEDSRVSYHPFYIAFACIVIPMQIAGLFITPPVNASVLPASSANTEARTDC